MFSNRLILSHTIISLFVGQLNFWMIFLNVNQLPPQIPLWYLQPWGPDQLTDKAWAWLMPGLSIGILAINLILLSVIHRRWHFLSSFVISTTTIANLFLLLVTANLLNRVLGWM